MIKNTKHIDHFIIFKHDDEKVEVPLDICLKHLISLMPQALIEELVKRVVADIKQHEETHWKKPEDRWEPEDGI